MNDHKLITLLRTPPTVTGDRTINAGSVQVDWGSDRKLKKINMIDMFVANKLVISGTIAVAHKE